RLPRHAACPFAGSADQVTLRKEPFMPVTRQPRICLIQPRFPMSYWGLEHFIKLTCYDAVFPPLGLLTLAALAPREFPVTLCDENAGDAIDYEADADIVGITGYIIQLAQVFKIADRFRAKGKTVV